VSGSSNTLSRRHPTISERAWHPCCLQPRYTSKRENSQNCQTCCLSGRTGGNHLCSSCLLPCRISSLSLLLISFPSQPLLNDVPCRVLTSLNFGMQPLVVCGVRRTHSHITISDGGDPPPPQRVTRRETTPSRSVHRVLHVRTHSSAPVANIHSAHQHGSPCVYRSKP